MTRSIPELPGATAVEAWFGEWPSFHDAEVVELHLNRAGASWLKVHTWLRTNETILRDGREYLKTDKNAVITFRFQGIVDLELADFSSQNVISELEIERRHDFHRLIMHPSYGLAGRIDARDISVEIKPGEPLESGARQSRDA